MQRKVTPAVAASFALAAAAPLAADPPRQGPIGPATASPPPPAKYGPIGPAMNEGPQGRDMTTLRNFSVEGSLLYMFYDADLDIEDHIGGRGRLYFPLTDGVEGALGVTGGSTNDEVDDESATTLDVHVGAFVRERWAWRGDPVEAYGGAVAGVFRVNGGDPPDASPFGGLEGGVRWFPFQDMSVGLGYEIMVTGTDANQRGKGSSAVLNNYLLLSLRYEF